MLCLPGNIKGHTPLIQLLTRRDVYLSDVNGTDVNEELLQNTSPIHLVSIHIHLIWFSGFFYIEIIQNISV